MGKTFHKLNFEDGILPQDEIKLSKWRLVYLYVFLVVLLGFLFWQLFGLQIVNGDKNLLHANTISRSSVPIRAPRGLIFDSNGQRLVVNIPAFTLYLNPVEIAVEKEEDTISKISEILSVDKEVLFDTYKGKAYNEKGKIPGLTRVTIKSGLTNNDFLSIQPQIGSLSGVYLEEDALRQYEGGEAFSHVIGYVGDAGPKDVAERGFDSNSQIGKIGIEEMYDEVLRGMDGVEIVEKDVRFESENVYIPESAKAGDNIVLTIDSRWQEALFNSLGKYVEDLDGYGGAAIIMEVGTGNIKSMISYPSFDNNLFSKGIDNATFNSLITDNKTPLVNKAIALQLPPGSTFKPILAATALQEGVINKNTTISSEGCMTLPGNIKFCEADRVYLGKMNVSQAIGKSSNVFFCNTGLQLTEKAGGIRTLMNYADQFGIGHKTDLGMIGEQAGSMATPELMIKVHDREWLLGDICNTAIGQGLVTTTPIQMLQVAEAVATGGKIYKPKLVHEVKNQEGTTIRTYEGEVVREIQVDDGNFALIKDGMYKAVNAAQGSAWILKGTPGNPYAKTGSADATEYIDGKPLKGAHSWVIGGFEYGGKEYNFVVHITLGGRGYKSVPVIKDFINCLYSDFAGLPVTNANSF
ncbi:hypothetical protein JW796_00215 [Candidatus Dojkabacteria bacterium]|nr:hypothetical protein [Candidatus Dojkabacteria bacterium]